MKTEDSYSTVLFVVPVVILLIISSSVPCAAIECSICRADRDSGFWSDQAECMFWPPIPRRCGSDAYTDCVTKLEFNSQNRLVGILRDCVQTNLKGCEIVQRDDGTVVKQCGWTCSTNGCNGNSLN